MHVWISGSGAPVPALSTADQVTARSPGPRGFPPPTTRWRRQRGASARPNAHRRIIFGLRAFPEGSGAAVPRPLGLVSELSRRSGSLKRGRDCA